MADVTPRKNETDAVVEILESDDYDDAKAAAKAIVRALYHEWRKREWWTVAYRVADTPATLLLGMEATEKRAEKVMGLLSGGHAMLAKVYPAATIEEIDLSIRRRAWDIRDHPCVTCGHRKWQHGAVGWKGKPIQVSGRKRCAINCNCKKYEAPEFDEEVNDGTETTHGVA